MAVKHLLIDADGCPVVREAVDIAAAHGLSCILFCDTAHRLELSGAETVTVSTGADSADFALVNRVAEGDIVVTQDYGLAAMCLAKGALILNQDGRQYTAENIEGLLYTRYVGKKLRRAGGRLKGPPKRKPEQTRQFCQVLEQLIENHG